MPSWAASAKGIIMDQLTLFDYGTLDLDTRSFVQTKTAEIQILAKQTIQGIIEIGKRLIEVKGRLEHGNWISWLKTEFEWSWDTAKRFMNVAETFGQNQQIADFQPSALYLLASPSTPESARTEALKLAESGEKITHQMAKEITDRHKAELEAKDEQITRLRKENDRVIRTKSADDAAIIRQQENFEKQQKRIAELTAQIEDLKAQVQEPQVIEKEKLIEVEKRIEVIPEDYDSLKMEISALKEKLQTSKQKSGEELSQYQARVKELAENLAKKESALAQFDTEQKQLKALGKLSEGLNCLTQAYNILGGTITSQPRIKSSIDNILQSYQQTINKFLQETNTIDLDTIEANYV